MADIAIFLAMVAVLVLVLAPLGSREHRVKTIKNCPEGRDCPYRVIYKTTGGLCPSLTARADVETMFKCCKFQKTLEGMERIQRAQERR